MPPPVHGGIMATWQELDAWVMKYMKPLVTEGREYHHDVLMEAIKAILHSATVSVIREGGPKMEEQVPEFFRISQTRLETRVRVRSLFSGVQVLIGDHALPSSIKKSR